MTISEAKIYLPFSDEDELIDVYEEKLFEFKQFFLAQAPIAKVFQAKLVKLEKLDLAFETLTGTPFQHFDTAQLEFEISDEVEKAFHYYEHQKNQLRAKIASAQNGIALKKSIENLLALVHAYQLKWTIGADLDIELEAISREPDSMEILAAIRVFSENGGIYFKDILEQKENHTLLKEMKRVSLLLERF